MRIPGKLYLVGGAVRDDLLGSETNKSDRDWVVTGTDGEAMQRAGLSEWVIHSRSTSTQRPKKNTRWRVPNEKLRRVIEVRIRSASGDYD